LTGSNAIKSGQDAFLQAIHIYAYMQVMIKILTLLVALAIGAGSLKAEETFTGTSSEFGGVTHYSNGVTSSEFGGVTHYSNGGTASEFGGVTHYNNVPLIH
jgi:hypothetical protein